MSGRANRTVRLDSAGRVPASVQTRLSSFLMSAHGAQARMLAAGSMPGNVGNPWQVEQHAQFCREMEIVTLLGRATRWVPDPMLMLLAWQWETAWLPHPVADARTPMEALSLDAAAFGHTLHSAIRPATLLPETADLADPFALALHRLEFESGRLLQAQLLLLKSDRLAEVRDAVTAAVAYRHAQIVALWRDVIDSLA